VIWRIGDLVIAEFGDWVIYLVIYLGGFERV
jgi:hypothetical protein